MTRDHRKQASYQSKPQPQRLQHQSSLVWVHFFAVAPQLDTDTVSGHDRIIHTEATTLMHHTYTPPTSLYSLLHTPPTPYIAHFRTTSFVLHTPHPTHLLVQRDGLQELHAETLEEVAESVVLRRLETHQHQLQEGALTVHWHLRADDGAGISAATGGTAAIIIRPHATSNALHTHIQSCLIK